LELIFLEQRVINYFNQSIEAKMQAGEILAPLIARASEILVGALLNDKKILTCGNGISAAHAQIFTASLMNSLLHERPSLPALSLGTDMISSPDVSHTHDFYAKQIRALGNPGDILILVTTTGTAANLLQAITAAHEKQMRVLALTGRDGGNVAALLDVEDLELRVPLTTKSRIHEVHLLSLFCLCELIDQQLFGDFQ
jgi:D-sedoheptulose 7-phosphate isomerase